MGRILRMFLIPPGFGTVGGEGGIEVEFLLGEE
jgi:hypothetical protein